MVDHSDATAATARLIADERGWGEGGLTRHSSLHPSRALQFELSWQCKVLCVFPSLNFVHYSHLHNMLLQCINIDAVDNVVLENHPLGELDNEEE